MGDVRGAACGLRGKAAPHLNRRTSYWRFPAGLLGRPGLVAGLSSRHWVGSRTAVIRFPSRPAWLTSLGLSQRVGARQAAPLPSEAETTPVGASHVRRARHCRCLGLGDDARRGRSGRARTRGMEDDSRRPRGLRTRHRRRRLGLGPRLDGANRRGRGQDVRDERQGRGPGSARIRDDSPERHFVCAADRRLRARVLRFADERGLARGEAAASQRSTRAADRSSGSEADRPQPGPLCGGLSPRRRANGLGPPRRVQNGLRSVGLLRGRRIRAEPHAIRQSPVDASETRLPRARRARATVARLARRERRQDRRARPCELGAAHGDTDPRSRARRSSGSTWPARRPAGS